MGLPHLRESMVQKVADGNEHARFTARLVRCARAHGVPAWIENPHTSYLWRVPEWREIVETFPASFVVVDFCQLGTPWRKRTRLYMADLGPQRVLCKGGHTHQKLEGHSRFHGKQWTKVAEHYPRILNSFIAEFLARPVLPLHQLRRLDLAACARCSGARIGEASKPGPGFSPEEVELVTPATARLQEKVLAGFQGWLSSVLSVPAIRSMHRCAMVYVLLLRAYGNQCTSFRIFWRGIRNNVSSCVRSCLLLGTC